MKPLYLVYGPEPFLKEEFLDTLKRTIAAGREQDLDISAFYGENSDINLSVILNTASFFAKHRLIVIKNAARLSGPQKKSVLNYIKNPCPNTSLVLETDKNSPEGEFLSALAKQASLIECNKLPASRLYGWIYKRAELAGKKIPKEAADLLLELKGNCLRSLAMELDKLASYAGGNGRITRQDVEDLVGRDITSGVFDLVGAIGRRDYQESLALVNSLGKSRKKETEIIGLLGWQFRRLWKGKKLAESKMGNANIARTLRVPARFAREFFEELDRFEESDIKRNLGILVEADKALKSTGARRDLILELVMVRLTGS